MNIGKAETMWAVISGRGDIWQNTIAYYKKDSIAAFTKKAGNPWDYWRKGYGYRCIKVSVTINEIK